MDNPYEFQRHARDNVKALQTYLIDLQNWETEMKRKESSLNGEFEQDLPPVRSKLKKEKPVVRKKKTEKRITSSDYIAWDKFDVDKACEEVDMAEVGPVSLDSKKSVTVKNEKLRQEAHNEKERGNQFVKQEKWDEAISCYNRAIELVQDEAIYYANRGLCHLMKESLHLAIKDCSEALKLDPKYVKALQRRASASEKLGSLRAASQDLVQVIKLEPQNVAARRQLDLIKRRMGTKGTKSKSSPQHTPASESKEFTTGAADEPKITELTDKWMNLQGWKDGVGEEITVIKPVKKPPHLRSKRSLKTIPIQEVELGRTNLDKQIAIETENLVIETKKIEHEAIENDINAKITEMDKGVAPAPEPAKLLTQDQEENHKQLSPPLNSVQFMSEWKYLKDKNNARGDYLSIIEPDNIPTIFANALESNVLSEILQVLHADIAKFKGKTVSAYLKALSKVKRFSTLTLFLSKNDKELLNNLLSHCMTHENLSENEIAELKEKYEL